MSVKGPYVLVLGSAILFGFSTPLAKLLIADIPPVALAGMLYLGAFVGLSTFSLIRTSFISSPQNRTASLERKDLPWLAGAIFAGGILAPICLMLGLTQISGFAASLFLNLEGVATALVAILIFREHAGARLWSVLLLMTLAGVFLAWDPGQTRLNMIGPLLVAASMLCWGIDNNLTRHISGKDSVQIALIKGLVAGTVSLATGIALGWRLHLDWAVALALLLGAISYGFSLVLFIKALQGLGSFRTGAFFSVAPFVGAVVSLALLGETLTWTMTGASLLMILGIYLMLTEHHVHEHWHEEMTHSHFHAHDDLHHAHIHHNSPVITHSHMHTHKRIRHEHDHRPDIHHRHQHKLEDK